MWSEKKIYGFVKLSPEENYRSMLPFLDWGFQDETETYSSLPKLSSLVGSTDDATQLETERERERED